MIKISKQNNSLIVEGIENAFYINNGDNSYPLNSLIVVTDNSDMATFRSVATNDVLFSGLINNITINGEVVTKDNIIKKFDAVSNSSTGGGTVDAYTKEEADNKFASKEELTAVETTLGNKQDTLVSGTNIKTVNSQSILGEGNLEVSGVSEEQAQEIAKIPTLETELAQKANVSDVPTVQTGNTGTNKNYIYSDIRSRYASVISKVYSEPSADKIDLMLYLWAPDTSQPSYYTQILSKATTTRAGVMSAVDKTKLDSIPETIPSQSEIDGIAANVSALQTAMDGKQATLVSGTNIKTINGNSILGEGNLVIEGGSSTPVKHTINLGANDPGKPYNEAGFGTLFLSLTVDQYDIDSINVNDEVELTWENSGKTVKGIVKEGYFTSEGQKLKYITTSFKIEYGEFEVRNVVFYNNTAIYLFPIVAPTETAIDPTVYHVYGVTYNQTNKWNNAAELNNYYDYKIGSQYIVPSIKDNFKGIVYRNNMSIPMVVDTFDQSTQFIAGQTIAYATTYTIGKGTSTGTLIIDPYGGQDVTINDDGSWTIPSIVDEALYPMYYNSAIYANGEIIKNAGAADEVTFHVGDKIQVVNEMDFGRGLFMDFTDVDTSVKINISYEVIKDTDATNQLLNQFNGNSYNIRSEANEWTGTQAEYGALTTKDNNTIYYVTE